MPLFESSFLQELNQISNTPQNPLPHLTSSFSTPTTSDVSVIKDAIGKSSSNAEALEKLLSRLKDVEKTLQERLNAERNYNSQLQGMVSTIRLLPPEVLSKIFLTCLPVEIDYYSRSTLKRKIPWSISRVCGKWRYICRSTPQLWVHIPTVFLNCNNKSGFFELLRTAAELSLPHGIGLRIRHTNADKIERLEDILPRVHFLDVDVDLPMIKGLVQRKESFKRLKSAMISFTSNSSEEPPILDFLAPVTSLELSCYLRCSGGENPYGLLRSVDSHWPNLTTFRGDRLPATFLRRILFAAPFLRTVTMHNTQGPSFGSSTINPAPTCHVNLKHLSLTYQDPRSIPHDLLRHLHLSGLKSLHVKYQVVSAEPFLSFLRETRGSLVKLDLSEPLGTFDDQREMYALCPALESLILYGAQPKNLDILAVSPQSKLCPALRYLTLHGFDLSETDDTRVFEDFCSSRGLAPLNTSNSPAGPFQLDRFTVYPEDPASFCQNYSRIGERKFMNWWSLRIISHTVCLSLSTHILPTTFSFRTFPIKNWNI